MTRRSSSLRWFRDRTRIEPLGRDHGVSRATAYRYVAEAVDVLVRAGPGPAEALERAMAEGVPYVILDGKVFATDRCSEPIDQREGRADRRLVLRQGPPPRRQRPGRHAPRRPPALGLRPSPARVHDITAARVHALPALYRAAALGMPSLADSGYEGAGIGILVPVKNPAGNQELDIGTRTRTRCCATCAAAGNAGSPCSPSAGPPSSTSPPDPDRTTEITRAALVLTQFEHKYIS